jgi:parallel beta-helix repeat protein
LKKSVAVWIILLFLLSSLIPLVYSDSPTLNKTIYVDDDGGADYTSIQDAIDAANSGDTIYVYSGTYYENVVVDKTIDLIGEDRETTIIDGCENGNVVYVIADLVSINGFTIQNSEQFEPGLYVNSDYNIISNNIITKNRMDGIYLWNSSNNVVSENVILVNGYCGINIIRGSNKNCILGNNISNNSMHGVYLLDHPDDNIISDNIIDCNSGAGVLINGDGTTNCSITMNSIRNNGYQGIYLWISYSNNISGNIIENNSGMGILFHGLCHSNVISGNTVIGNNREFYNDVGGIGIGYSRNNVVSGNDIRDNAHEDLYLFESTNTKIINNNIVDDGGTLAFFEFETSKPFRNLLNTYIDSFTNRFIGNYWGKRRLLPKPIKGEISFYVPPFRYWSFPGMIFDWHPAKEPYDIPKLEI